MLHISLESAAYKGFLKTKELKTKTCKQHEMSHNNEESLHNTRFLLMSVK